MIGELIKEYLVGLGVQIDKPGFRELEDTIGKTDATIAKATSGWAKNFAHAGAVVATALASVTASAVGLMTTTAKQDLAMEKYARNMLISKDAAWEMKSALDALGESVQDIQLTPELMGRYKALVADGRKMKVGGDYDGTMRGIRDTLFEFTRLKQEASYALKWVGYYLAKYLSQPLAEARRTLKSLNDRMIKNMPAWTAKIAQALVYVVNIGRHFFDLLKAIGKTVADVWDAFPRGAKTAGAALTGFFLLLKASPLYRMIALISSLLLLVDDYFAYMEGKKVAFAPAWEKLNALIDTSKGKLREWGAAIGPVWQDMSGWLSDARDGIGGLADQTADWFDVLRRSDECREFVEVSEDLVKAVYELGGGVVDSLTESVKNLLKSLDRQDTMRTSVDLIKKLWGYLNDLLQVLSDLIRTVGKWLREMGRSSVMRELIGAVVELFGALMDLIGAFTDLCDVILQEFFTGIGRTQPVLSFKDALHTVVSVLRDMVRFISKAIDELTDLFKLMRDNRIFKAFWRGLGEAAGLYCDVVMRTLGAVGRLGQALMALVDRHFDRAADLAGEAVDILFGSKKAEAGALRGGFKGTGDAERDEWIKEAAKEFGVPAAIIAAVMNTESSFDPNARSSAGARGYMQLMPDTAKALGVNIDDPRDNIRGGAKYLREMYEQFGDWEKAFAAYNAGPTAVKEYGGIPPYKETQEYIKKIFDDIKNYISTLQPGAGEGATWYKVEAEDPKYEQLQPKAKIGVEEVSQIYYELTGEKLGLTSGMRNKELGYSDDEIGGHSTGLKVDVIAKGLADPAVRDEFIRRCEEIGIKVINEYEQKFGHTTGDHLDLNMADYDYRPSPENWRQETPYAKPRESVSPQVPQPEGVMPQPQPPVQPIPAEPQESEEEDGILIQGAKTVGKVLMDAVSAIDDFHVAVDDAIIGFGKIALESFGGDDAIKPTAFAQSAFKDVDPRLLQDMRAGGNGETPAYASGGGRQSIVVQNTVHVGDIHVANSNASPKEIGNAVADETMRRMDERANYVLQNRSLSGGVLV